MRGLSADLSAASRGLSLERPSSAWRPAPRPSARRAGVPLPLRSVDPSVVDAVAETVAFSPQMDASIAFAALFAAVPPVLFWIRVVKREKERQQEADDKEKARLDLKAKLFGDKR